MPKTKPEAGRKKVSLSSRYVVVWRGLTPSPSFFVLSFWILKGTLQCSFVFFTSIQKRFALPLPEGGN
jgi:hypothetical protein